MNVKISTKGRYGLRTLLDIASQQGDDPTTLSELAHRQHISVKYLWQVINPLKTAGIIGVTRGAKGGYYLIKRPDKITLLEVISILEGDIFVTDCLSRKGVCKRQNHCMAYGVWQEINEAIKKTLGKVTLAELLQRCAECNETPAYMI